MRQLRRLSILAFADKLLKTTSLLNSVIENRVPIPAGH
jgi:hypothetical protein